MAASLRSMDSIWSGFKVFWAHTIDEYGPNMMDFFDQMKWAKNRRFLTTFSKSAPVWLIVLALKP